MDDRKQFPRLEIHIVNHCNLNCRACAHFSNICSEFFMDLSQFKKDISEINKKINYQLINILGGEPLLHPDLADFLYAVRKICTDKIITLTTNGILLPSLNEKIWEAFRVNKIYIRLSAYPPTLNKIKNYIGLIREKKVEVYVWIGEQFHLRKSFDHVKDKNSIWETCDAKICHQLYQGKIYPCSFDAYGKFYNQYFNKNFYFDDGIDIYNNSANEIIQYLTNPVRNCMTCTKYGQMIKWEFSKFKDNEWDVQIT